MKESPGRYMNPFLSDEENEKVNLWYNQQVGNSIVDGHFASSNIEDEKRDKSLAPANVVPSEKSNDRLYVDKIVTECYEERGFHVVKDICVDEGVLVCYKEEKKRIEIDKQEQHESSCNPIIPTIVNGDKHDDMIKDDIGTQHKQLKSFSPLEDHCYDNTTTHLLFSGTKDDNVASNCAADKLTLIAESKIVRSFPDNSVQNGEGELDSSFIKVLEPSVNDVDQQLSSEAHSTRSETDELKQSIQTKDTSNEVKMEENTALNSGNLEPPAIHKVPLDTQSAPNHHDMASYNITVVVNQLQQGGGGSESSISMADPVSGLITYSGPIASSGSISHRSDGSNSSVRSFAFPILQNEWNSSPVRMGKVDQRQTRKRRGWRHVQALMCCRF